MKVLHICSYYIDDKFYTSFFDELSQSGVVSKAFVFANRNRLKDGLDLPYATISYCFRTLDRFFFHIKHLKALRQLYRCENVQEYDCLHAHSLFSNGYLAYRVKKRYGIPYVITVRYPDIYTFFKFRLCLRPLGKRILKQADSVIFLSEASACAMREYYDLCGNYEIIPNGIDDFWIEHKAKRKEKSNNGIKLLFVGRINRNKNIDILVRICDQIRSRYDAISLTVVGQVMDQSYMEVLNSRDYVTYIPYCKKEDLIKYYRQADIFVLLSHKESFGIVYTEAMSQGLPILYTKNQGFDKQFEDGYVGYACDDYDETDALAAIEKILDKYDEISHHCVEAVDRFSWNYIAEAHVNLYESLKGNDSFGRQ